MKRLLTSTAAVLLSSSANPASKSVKSSEATLPDNNCEPIEGRQGTELGSAELLRGTVEAEPPTINDKNSGQY